MQYKYSYKKVLNHLRKNYVCYHPELDELTVCTLYQYHVTSFAGWIIVGEF